MLYAVIIAGGSGTRFWPASRRDLPKQMLPLAGDRTMLQMTSDRLGEQVPPERRMVLTNESLVDQVCDQLPEIPRKSIVGEPCKRDTAPCIGLAAHLVSRIDPDASMLVMPADHVITTETQFQNAIQSGLTLLEQDPQRIVTFGIKPTYAADSFGYVQAGDSIPCGEISAFNVECFQEKPDVQTAEKYCDAGTYYWNSGIFLWRASTILSALERYEPEMSSHLHRIGQAAQTPEFDEVLKREFAAISGKSIDYAVMEHYGNVAVIEAPFQWDDLGSWRSIARINPSDPMGNTVLGKHVGIDTKGTIVYGSDDHLVVTVDLDDLIVVRTPQSTLIAPKSSEQRVREVVKQLETRGLEDFL